MSRRTNIGRIQWILYILLGFMANLSWAMKGTKLPDHLKTQLRLLQTSLSVTEAHIRRELKK